MDAGSRDLRHAVASKGLFGVLASKHAAEVALYVAAHLPANVGKAAATFGDLSRVSNARRAGYVVTNEAFTEIGPVTKEGSGHSRDRRWRGNAAPTPTPPARSLPRATRMRGAIAADPLRNPARDNSPASSRRRR